MKNDSQLIAALFSEARLICRDVALLFQTAEESFRRREWFSAQSTKVAQYSGSNSLDWPDFWIPRRFFRWYSNAHHAGFLCYVAIVFDPPVEFEIADGMAVLTAGGLHQSTPKGIETPTGEAPCVFDWHLFRADRIDDSVPRWHVSPFEWREGPLPDYWEGTVAGIDRAVTSAVPLHQVTSAGELESRIVDPIVKAIVKSETT